MDGERSKEIPRENGKVVFKQERNVDDMLEEITREVSLSREVSTSVYRRRKMKL